MTYSHEQLKAMCPLSISECSQKHVQSVVAELIETALAQPASAKERWNIERDGDALLVCFNSHEKGEACRYERFVPEAQPANVPALDKQAAFEAWLENCPIKVVGDDYELCSDAFDAGVLAAAPAAPQPAQAVMAPEYAAAVRELAEQSDMSEAQVLRAAVRLYQAEQKGLVTVEHKEQIGPLAAPQPEAQPQWQPIETAPKDSTSVLIYTPNSRKQVQEAWWAIQYEGSIDGYWSTPIGPAGRGYTILPEAATHWMPLPAAPSAQAPQPEAQPPIGFFAFDPDNGVEFFKTMQEAEQYAAQALEVYREAAKFDGEWIDDVEAVRVGIVTQRAAAVEYEEGTDYEMRPAAPSAQAPQPEAQPQWQLPAQRLVQWLHCMSYNDSYFGEPAGYLKQCVNELKHLLPPNEVRAAPSVQAEPIQHCASRGGTGAECDCEAQAEQGGK